MIDRAPFPTALPNQWCEVGEQLASVGAIGDPKKFLGLCTQLEAGLSAAENDDITLQVAAQKSNMNADRPREERSKRCSRRRDSRPHEGAR